VSDSFEAVFRVAGAVFLALALCLALAMGLAACGGDDATDTTVEVSTTEVDVTATTTGETVTSEDSTATSEETGAVDTALLGKWHSEQTGETLEFTSDGKMIITSDTDEGTVEFNYSVEGANVVFGLPGVQMVTVPYSIDGDVLTIVDPDVGGPVTCDRVT
jgi:hypothetical protein